MRIGLAQINCAVDDIAANTAKATDFIKKASAEGCDVVTLPEIADLGYVLPKVAASAFTLAENPYLAAITQAANTHSISVISGLAERDAENPETVYNTVAAINPSGELIAKYRKTHLVTIEPMREQMHLAAGDDIVVTEIAGIPSGIMTCYDLRFPELARAMALRGAKVIYLISAFPTARAKHWEALISARAIENQLFVAASNSVGSNGPDLEFCGLSQVIDPNGVDLNDTSSTGESLYTADVDLSIIDDVRAKVAVFNDRRPELYGDLLKP